ncbi:NAD(P)-binding protein [Lentinus tigrinus ALCF2SS1-6]|uniref:NAD(P)-binding protein n=1 Tax=Lentinus tigrinus ALCF2SS1-6 TaxID=1328759 RepID=A0A5C2S5N2_9APHY|nr:NAD(P)-binding protein [Lentinus tigrinus ALCF2SS1-6]
MSRIKGNLKLVQHAVYPPKPHWTPDQLPDLSGRVMLVTGGNTGIGKEMIKELLKHNAKLNSLASVRKAAEEFLSKEEALHTLFNNAGVMWAPVADVTADGYDMQFGTNVLGPFLLTQLLLPALLKGKASSPDGHARIVITSSAYAYLGHLDFETFKDGPARRKLSTEELYNQSKLADVLVTFELARRYGEQGIIAVALNPGILKMELMRHINANTINWPAPMGAITPLYAGAAPEGLKLNGKWLIPWAREEKCCNEQAYDEKLAGHLWDWLEEQVKKPGQVNFVNGLEA